MSREFIEAIGITAHEMREHRTRDDGILMLQLAYQLLHIVLWVEAQTMHTCIQLDVDRESGDSLLLGCLDQRIEQTEGIYLRLQVVIKHSLEGGHLRVHDHDVAGDAVLAKGNALIGYCHGKIIHTVILQGLGYLHGSCSITVCLDHADQFGFRLHKCTVVVQIGYHGIQVHFERGFVYLLNQQLRQLVETKLAGALQQDYLVTKRCKYLALDKLLHILEEELF